MVDWAKENAKASGFEDRPIRYLVDDVVKFVEREIRPYGSFFIICIMCTIENR